MNELAGQSLGGYLLEEEIGRGSMGMVYRGKQIALGREVAVKVLPQSLAHDTSYVARFIREAQIIAGLNHPNIIHIYDAGQQNKLLYFVMEYIQGPTLANLIHFDNIILQPLAIEYVAQIADALDAAYKERNVIHRDIKPENIMLDRWGKIRVMDFGLARAPGHQRITVAKTLVGSIYYASPEQVWGHNLDNRSDIYALGVVFYEMVSGQRPFTGHSMPELTQAITSGTLYPPSIHNPEIPPELERIILKAMARDRNQRYEDAGLMAKDLREFNMKQFTPTPGSASTFQELPSSHKRGTRREPLVIHPPKRPQAQKPRYYDVEPTAHTPNQQVMHPSSTAQEVKETQTVEEQNIDIDGPTNPLEVFNSPNMSAHQPQVENSKALIPLQSSPKTKQQSTFWNQLLHLFRRSSQ
jgi:serine/threonine-protein kinase